MTTDAPNAAQAEYWNAARHWVDDQAGHDAMLEPIGRLGLDALAASPGERILDVGCGTGTTTFALADAVAPGGSVVGADISALLLERARERAGTRRDVTFVDADAQTYSFEPASFDAAFSRFGVMFFSDSEAAFANVRAALQAGGRLTFVCWQEPAANEWVSVPAAAVRPWVELSLGTDTGPGPFSLADPDMLRGVLSHAGFSDVAVSDQRTPALLGGPGDIETAMVYLNGSRFGREIAEGATDPDAAFAAVRDALAKYLTPRGVEMTAAVWVVTASA